MLKNLLRGLVIKALGLEEMVAEKEQSNKERALKAQATIKERNKNSHISKGVSKDTREDNRDRSGFNVVKGNFDKMNGDWIQLQRTNPTLSRAILMEVSERAYALAPEELPTILCDYGNHILESYAVRVLNQAGQFDKEKDNLEALDREELIRLITDISLYNYDKAMKDKGLSSVPTEKMMDMLRRNKVDLDTVKTYKYAKSLINNIIASADPTPGENQLATIKRMVDKLGLQGEDLEEYGIRTGTKTECSNSIKVLIEMCDTQFGDLAPSEAQVETYKRYLKMSGKRITKNVENKIAKMNSRQISAEIKTMKEEYQKAHPYASEGQVNFIMSLCNQLFIDANRADVEKMLPAEATGKIRELQEELLYCKAMAKNVSMSKNYIKGLSKDELKLKLDELSGRAPR